MEKKALKEQIKELETRVSVLENINSDLINRNRMLEYCLRQMKYLFAYAEDKRVKLNSNQCKTSQKCLKDAQNQTKII